MLNASQNAVDFMSTFSDNNSAKNVPTNDIESLK